MTADSTLVVGTDRLAREISIRAGSVETVALLLGPAHGRIELSSTELELVVDTATWRYDIPHWRWSKTSRDAGDDGRYRPGFDDSGWDVCPHLHPLFHASYDGCAWFRHELVLPVAARDEPVTLVLGGFDGEDWTSYRAFLNGQPIGAWDGGAPANLTFAPGDERRSLLSFDGPNLLAVEATGLDRHTPGEQPAEREHYLFQGWLLDQFVAVGEPYAVGTRLDVIKVRAAPGSPAAWAELDCEVPELPGFRVTLSYRVAEGDLLRKSVTVRNDRDEPVRLLDVTLERWAGPFRADGGGRGQPVLDERFFVGVEHPAGVALANGGELRALQMPGRVLAPGAAFESETAVVGVAREGGSVEETFRNYVRGLRPRRRERVTKYSALGWYDFTNPADPLPELTEELVDENVTLLESLAGRGVAFDVYMLDDWWEPTDLASFRRRTFPAGASAVAGRIRDGGLSAGLWWATTRAVWSSDRAPGVEAAVAGGTGLSPEREAREDGAGQWAWDDEFGAMFTREKRFCPAAEPYRSMALEAIPGYVRSLELACLKFDCSTLHCTSSDHDHLPGRHSVEPIVNTMIELVEAAAAINPELVVIWYWTFRSPWWLRHGDTMFDKGLKMELGSPATAPAPIYRQSINLHLDQAARHARLVPSELQDSLGLWWGNVALTNRFGTEEWREACLLELARGSAVFQFWGDIALLDDDDLRFLADVLAWSRRPLAEVVAVGGDPRLDEPYGYAERSADGAIVTLVNPTFEQRRVRVDPAALGLPGSPFAVHEAYPFPGLVEADGRELDFELKPFELRCLELLPPARVPPTVAAQERPPTRASRTIDLTGLDRQVDDRGDRTSTHVARGAVVLPQVERHDHLVLVVRLERDGAWWYHPDPRTLVGLSARLKGTEVYCETVPRVRARTGLGSPWILFAIPAGTGWSGERLELRVVVHLPAGVDPILESHLYEPWSRRAQRRFAPLPTGRDPDPERTEPR